MRSVTMGLILMAAGVGLLTAGEVGYRNDGTGVWPGVALPELAGADLPVRWTTPLPGAGYSQPLLVGDLVVVTTEPDQVLALDAATGAIRWRATCSVFSEYGDQGAKLEALFTEAHGLPDGSPRLKELQGQMKRAKVDLHLALPVERPAYATPSPCTDGTRIVVAFTTGVLAAYDLAGKPLWKQRVAGMTDLASPRIVAGVLLVARKKKPGHLGLDPATGKVIWDKPEVQAGSWGTPLVVTVGGRRYCVSGGGQIFDPATGTVLATVAAIGQHTTQAVWQDLLVVPEGHFYNAKKNPQLRAYRLSATADGVQAPEVWSVPAAFGNCSTAVAWHGRVLFSDGGTIRSFAAADGTTGPAPFKPGIKSSPHVINAGLSAVDDRVVALGEDGTLRILRVGDDGVTQERESKLPAPERTAMYRAAPTFTDGRIYVHGNKALTCLGR